MREIQELERGLEQVLEMFAQLFKELGEGLGGGGRREGCGGCRSGASARLRGEGARFDDGSGSFDTRPPPVRRGLLPPPPSDDPPSGGDPIPELPSDGSTAGPAGSPYADGIGGVPRPEVLDVANGDPEFERVANTPTSKWLASGSPQDAAREASEFIDKARGGTPTLIAYNRPDRDAGNYSAGGAKSYQDYIKWIEGVSAGIGNKKAALILEPDALNQAGDNPQLLAAMRQATEIFKKNNPNLSVYINAGNNGWPVSAQTLIDAGIANTRGFATNTSQFQQTDEEIAYATKLRHDLAALGVDDMHAVIDTSRAGAAVEGWCNPVGAALGRPPTGNTGVEGIDAFLWNKPPGDSDGLERGPAAGVFSRELLRQLIENARR